MTSRKGPIANLAAEDQVQLFPSLAYPSGDGRYWIVNIHGDISSQQPVTFSKRMLLKLLRRTMRATAEDFATPLFQERIRRFLAADRPGRRVAVRIGDDIHKLPKKSRRNGHFHASLRVPKHLAQEWVESAAIGGDRYLPLEVVDAAATGRAYLLEHTGLSVISDIDDTLKHSHVACRRTLLTNTFLRPYETIPGMAPLFRQWWAEGAAFHYVSSSPWQLYDHLTEHLADEGFPPGSFHLKLFRLRDHLLRRLLLLRRSGKLGVIRGLLKMFPHRRFLLVGDSGEHDPEIYGALARRYPQQIAGVFIRQLAAPQKDLRQDLRRRYGRAFRRVDLRLVRIFEDAEELANINIQ
ncbi:MAG TPA: phosphatase domain-containing protein [Pirellulaceae bacterium]|jgi:phosphatidate phosphatase APP1